LIHHQRFNNGWRIKKFQRRKKVKKNLNIMHVALTAIIIVFLAAIMITISKVKYLQEEIATLQGVIKNLEKNEPPAKVSQDCIEARLGLIYYRAEVIRLDEERQDLPRCQMTQEDFNRYLDRMEDTQ
jgi:hypothetical protein